MKKSVKSNKDYKLSTFYEENDSRGDNNYNSIKCITVRDFQIEKEEYDVHILSIAINLSTQHLLNFVLVASHEFAHLCQIIA